ncbi:MAG: Trk system potassium transporter TrkA [Deltaproteobacteria bacterium]|nr:Trk system potassium transporter TrkA [Deltaproteobacteria bacterium]
MNIVVIGAGVVGTDLAEQLSTEGHRVAVVDSDRRKVKELNEKLDVLGVYGNAGMPSILDKAGIRAADMVIAVTDVDEINLVVGMLAARLGVKHRIVRIRNREYTAADALLPLGELGIDHVINPEPSIVQALAGMLEYPGSCDYATLADGQVLMLGFDIAEDSPSAGKTLAELREVGDLDAFLFLYIHRGDEVIVPRGSDCILPGDNVHVLASADTVKFVLPMIHRRPVEVDCVIISGTSRVALKLAETIQDRVERVYLIEPDPERAEEAAADLKKVTVLRGEPTDLDVLEEAALDKCDLFCALADDDQRNMLSALLVKRHGRALAAVQVHQPEFVPVLDSLGVEIVLNPRLVTVGEIMMHVRRGHVHSVTRLAEGRAEILEMEVPEGSPAVKSKLRELDFPKNALLGAIVRDGIMQIPSGETICKPGDTVLVFALPDAIGRIEKLFTRRRWFAGS